jgi:hypothetical protein
VWGDGRDFIFTILLSRWYDFPNDLIFTDIRFEVSMAVTVKNAVFWDIKPRFVLHRRHITSPLQNTAS